MMIRWILFFTFVCFSSASYATCTSASGSIQFASPIYVDLSDKLNATNTTWTATYSTQYAGPFSCSTGNSKFGYTKTLSHGSNETILGFENNKNKVLAEITAAPTEKTLSNSGNHNGAELNTSFSVRFTLVSSGEAISVQGNTAQLGDVLFVTDLSGMSVLEILAWPLNQLRKLLIWLTNGFHWPYDSKDLFGQPMTIKYAPKATTCTFNNTGLTVRLPTMGLQQVTRGQTQPGLTPFNLNFSCKGISTSGTSDRAIEMFLSSNNLHTEDSTVLIDKNSSATKGIGLRLIKRNGPQSPVVFSSSNTVRGEATTLFSVQENGTLSDNFEIPMAAYYYAWNPLNATQGSLNTSAMLNIIYP